MKPITLFIIVFISLMVCFWGGYLLGARTESTPVDLSTELNSIHHERDSLQVLFNASRNREQLYILKAEQDSIKRIASEKKAAYFESKTKTYAERLKENEKITIAQPDSFLIKRYPQLNSH